MKERKKERKKGRKERNPYLSDNPRSQMVIQSLNKTLW